MRDYKKQLIYSDNIRTTYEHAYGDERFFWTNKIAGIPLQINSAQKKHACTTCSHGIRFSNARISCDAPWINNRVYQSRWSYMQYEGMQYAVLEPIYIQKWMVFLHIYARNYLGYILSWLASSQLPITFGRIGPLATASTAVGSYHPVTYTNRSLDWSGKPTI